MIFIVSCSFSSNVSTSFVSLFHSVNSSVPVLSIISNVIICRVFSPFIISRSVDIFLILTMMLYSPSSVMSDRLVIFSSYFGRDGSTSSGKTCIDELFFICTSRSPVYPFLTSRLFTFIMFPSSIRFMYFILSVHITTRIFPLLSSTVRLATFPSLPFFVVNVLMLDIDINLPCMLIFKFTSISEDMGCI